MKRGKLGGWRRGTLRDRALPVCPCRVDLIVLFCGAFARVLRPESAHVAVAQTCLMEGPAKFLIDNGSRD